MSQNFFFLQLNCVESLYVWSDIKRKHTIFIVLRNLTWIMGRLRTTTWETILTVNHVHDFITTITVKWARKCAQIRYFPSYLHAIHHFEPSIWPIYALEIEFFFWNSLKYDSTDVNSRALSGGINEASRRSQKESSENGVMLSLAGDCIKMIEILSRFIDELSVMSRKKWDWFTDLFFFLNQKNCARSSRFHTISSARELEFNNKSLIDHDVYDVVIHIQYWILKVFSRFDLFLSFVYILNYELEHIQIREITYEM